MPFSVIGVFKHSGDAEMAATYLREEFALEANELDLIGETAPDRLAHPAPGGPEEWVLASVTGMVGLNANMGEDEPIGKRWGDKVQQGDVLVVARTNDPDIADALAREMRVNGADRIDMIRP